MNPIASGAFAWALARLAEPSTYAGFAGVVGSMTFLPHAGADATVVQQLGVAIVALCGAVAIVRKEKGSTK